MDGYTEAGQKKSRPNPRRMWRGFSFFGGKMIRRLICAAAALASLAAGAPTLTTIQDVLYKADGTRFNGTLTISWNSFQSADNSDIVTQMTTVKVLDGNLRVQLVPSPRLRRRSYIR